MVTKLNILGDKLRAYAGFIPFILMLFNLIGYFIFVHYYITGNETKLMCKFDLFTKQISDISLFGLLILLMVSRAFKFVSWVSYLCLLALWIINTIYIVFDLPIGLYFTIIISAIYSTFVILTIGRLTNRW